MKSTIKEISDFANDLAKARSEMSLSNAEIGRISGVHPSQVGRICEGNFKTFSHNVVQVCNALGVTVPQTKSPHLPKDPSWVKVERSIRKLWDATPEGARSIARMLDAIADVSKLDR